MGIIESIKSRIERKKHNARWREKNRNNTTELFGFCDMDSVSVGNHTYGPVNVLNFSDDHTLKIGNCVSIAPEVWFIPCADHNLNTVSTFPFKVKILGSHPYEAVSKGDIIVEDDVWIGYRATILSGVHIGQGAVIGAGALVDKDVPPYAVVGGVPAKVIKYRFDDAVIKFLLTLDFGSLTKQQIEEHINDLYVGINDAGPDEVKRMFEWFPKKKG
ncbi:MAG: CatB-related O-acetyltransferase [Lachnospiraceae bacterium]|nr:CatB-related O-acetyltransferase [Lachnospiraceae bacterium]